MYKIIKDVSRVRHCFLGRTCFSVGRTENRLHGRKKKKKKTKSSVNANFKRQEKQSQCERYISPTTTLNIPISHYGEMIDLLKQK